jgi:hypothetical protein
MKKNNFILLFLVLFFSIFILCSKDARASYCTETAGGACVPVPTDNSNKCSDGTYGTQGYGCPDKQMCCSGSSGSASNIGTGVTFPNPLGFKTVIEFLNKFLASLRGVVAVIAIIFIVLGGIMYMLSAGSEKMITRAKMCWTGAVVGLAIVLAAPSFLKEIMTILGANVDTGGNVTQSTLTLFQIATNVLNLLLSVLGIIAIISLVVGGGMYLTSYGDEKRIETGKKIIQFSIIGIIIALGAVVIINEISRLIAGA